MMLRSLRQIASIGVVVTLLASASMTAFANSDPPATLATDHRALVERLENLVTQLDATHSNSWDRSFLR